MQGKKTLFVALISCVFLFAVASGALAVISRTAVDPIDSAGAAAEYVSVAAAEDYLVNVEGVVTYADALLLEEDFLLKRSSDLKWTVFDTPGNAAVDYTKVVYTVSLKLRDLSLFTGGVTGLAVSDLTIGGFGVKTPTLVSASLTINGAAVLLLDGGALDASNYITWVYDAVTGTLSARVTLPSLDLTTALAYKDGDMVTVFVMFKTPEPGLTITGGDIGFPDYQ